MPRAMTEAMVKTAKFICTTPLAIVMILYGNGVIPAPKTIHAPCSLYKSLNELNFSK